MGYIRNEKSNITQKKWEKMKTRILNSEENLGRLFVLPIYFLVFVVIGYPFIYTIILSFTNKRVGYPYKFVGLENYRNLFKDPLYWKIIINTVVYTVVCIVVKLILGMAFALLLNEQFRFRGVVRVGMLIPWAIPGMVAAHTWKWMYNDQYGIINSVLKRLGLISTQIPWLSDMHLALVSVMIVNIWRGIPFFLFSILGGLQAIDKQLYDAAKIDGAGVVHRFFSVTMPSVKPVVVITTLLSTIWTFNDFDNVWLITGGGPLYASSIISTYTYDAAFITNEMAYGLSAAVSVIPILLIFLIFATKSINERNS